MIPNQQFNDRAHYHQLRTLEHFTEWLDSGNRRSHFIALEWHRRARKTTLAMNLLIRECYRLPLSKFVYVAPTKVMARNIVWDDPVMLRAYLPDKREMRWDLNEQKMMVRFANGSVLQLGGSDDPDSLRGIDAVGLVLDEWSLHKIVVWTEIFRPIIAGALPQHLQNKKAFRWAMFLYTPKGVNHASTMFDDAICLAETGVLPVCGEPPKTKPRWHCSRLDGEKSGILPASELKEMREDPTIPQAMYDQEIRCSRVTIEEMTLITSAMLQRLNQHHATTHYSAPPEEGHRKVVSIDPAFGGDVCKIIGIVDYRLESEQSIVDRHRTAEIVAAGKVMAARIGTGNFVVDCIGSGLGVADGLADDVADYNVIYFNSSERPSAKGKATWRQLRFGNKRAEAYFRAAEGVRTLRAGPIRSDTLLRQLPVASCYAPSGQGGKLLIIPKHVIKKELGRSPDDADAYVMGIWAMGEVEVEYDEGVVVPGGSSVFNMLPDTVQFGI
jgi:hypothetical protein